MGEEGKRIEVLTVIVEMFCDSGLSKVGRW